MTEGLHPKMGIKAQQKKTVLESFLGLGRSLSYLQLLESLFKKLASRVTLIRKLIVIAGGLGIAAESKRATPCIVSMATKKYYLSCYLARMNVNMNTCLDTSVQNFVVLS
ncbi:unnamed protein product [Clavelina lepadiformis]|uniref:Uncharacterized protein n=1 Tax=Clavelina lepadiformis TaxID=159417 RepID=A0ABP0F9M8_CLALP